MLYLIVNYISRLLIKLYCYFWFQYQISLVFITIILTEPHVQSISLNIRILIAIFQSGHKALPTTTPFLETKKCLISATRVSDVIITLHQCNVSSDETYFPYFGNPDHGTATRFSVFGFPGFSRFSQVGFPGMDL